MVRNVFCTSSEYNYAQFHRSDVDLWLANLNICLKNFVWVASVRVVTLQCDYYNRDHLDKVDQLDDKKITRQSEKVSFQSLISRNKIDNMDRNQPVTTYRRDLLPGNLLKKTHVSWEVR